MPWTAANATSHTKKADTPKKRSVWARVANQALAAGNSEGSAIRQANEAVRRMGKSKHSTAMSS